MGGKAVTSEEGNAEAGAGARRHAVLFLIVLAGALGIFVVPWFVPHSEPVASASYTLGFNNIVASLALAALLTALFVWFLRRPVQEGSVIEKALAEMLAPPGSGARSLGLLIAFGTMAVATIALLLAWYQVLPFINFGEFGADVSRLDLMVLGLKPHVDFQYNYGPAMLYPAYWLYSALGGKMSIDAAYCVILLTHWAAGLSLLFYTVGTLCRGRNGTVVFLCVSLAVFNLSMGVGYSPLRFLLPLACLLFLHRTFCKWSDNGTAGLARLAAVAALLSLASLSISPEMGISTSAGIIAFFAALFFTPHRRYSILALVPLVALGVAVFVFSANYLEGVFSVGGGANNFPIFPTPHVLFLVAAGCLVLPRLGVIGVRERNPNGALAIGLVIALGLLLPAAFGRCDPGHLLFNGLGIAVLFLALAIRIPNRVAASLMTITYLLIHPIIGNIATFPFLRDPVEDAIDFRRAIAKHFPFFNEELNEGIWRAASTTSNGLRYGKLAPFASDLPSLLRYDVIGMPFYSSEVVDRFIKLSGRFSPQYHSGVNIQLYTPADVARKIRDLRTASILLVPKDHQRYPVVVNETDRAFLSKLLFFPKQLIPPPRRNPYLPGREVMKHIQDNFVVVDTFRTFDIWSRKSP